jgi:L-ascorbate metabolism protein UlaG (beta-lactamase superfamily)
MKIRQIRNATLVIEYGGTRFLIDPWLAPEGTYPGFEGTPNSETRIPTVDLVVPMAEILDVDAVILTHVHLDHWDEVAAGLLPKDIPFFTQHAGDRETIRAAGFTDVRVLSGNPVFGNVKLIKVPGQHGSDECVQAIYDLIGEVCGVVFRHPAEKTLYLAGDTVYNDYVAGNLAIHRPEVIVVNACDAQVTGLGSIIMGKEDLRAVYRAAPRASIVASHMEAVNHATVDRAAMRAFIDANGLQDRVRMPADGETLSF